MKKITLCLLLTLLGLTALACAPRPSDPAEMITENKARELRLLGSWKLITVRDGSTPAPNQVQTLNFSADNVMKMDLWEHELTFKYEVAPDPDHLRLTWTGSTNPNDKPGGVVTRVMVITGDNLSLDGDQFKRVAVAGGTTVTPEPSALPFPTPTPQVNVPPPSAVPNLPATIEARLGEEFVLHLSETAVLTDSPNLFGIKLYNIKDDSRCPQEVTCVWAGELRFSITFQEGKLLHPPIIDMTTNAGDPNHIRTLDGYRVEVTGDAPPAHAGITIPKQDYAITFRVTQEPAAPTPLPNQVEGALDQPVTLKMFNTLQLRQVGLQVTLTGVLQDSRCPKSVNCAQAGRALLAFRLEKDGKLGFLNLSSQPPDGRMRGSFRGYTLELLNVDPYPETPNQEIPAIQYSATVVVRQTPPQTTVGKNEGFVLHIGDSISLADENATVQLVSVTKDSRCPYMVMCAVRGNAVVEVKLTEAGGATSTFILNEDNSTPNQRIPDTGLYGVELLALNPYPRGDITPVPEIAPAEYQVTLVVRKFAVPQGVPTKTPVALTNCAGMTAQDATALAGEPLQTGPLASVRIQVPADDDAFAPKNGVCGFLSVAKNTSDVVLMNDPYELENQSNAAVTAARLRGADVAQLLRIIGIVRYAGADTDSTPYIILKTRIAAGDWDGMFENLATLAKDIPNVHVELVDSFGDEGAWIWRAATVRNYAALVVRDQNEFVIVEALTGKNVTEAAAEEAMHSVMGKLVK